MPDFTLSLAGHKTLTGTLDVPVSSTRFRLRWDDELPDWGYKSRTLDGSRFPSPGFNAPAVLRFAPEILPPTHDIGDYRVNISEWKLFFLSLNGGDEQKFTLWTKPGTAQFNTTGWPMLAYLGMSGNRLQGERVGDWFRFVTLRPSDVGRVAGWTIQTHPEFIHRFTCVSWDAATKTTKHIESTGTPRGQIYYPLISKEGAGYIPWRFVIAI